MDLADLFPKAYLVAAAWRRWFDTDCPPFDSIDGLTDWNKQWNSMVELEWAKSGSDHVPQLFDNWATAILAFRDDPKYKPMPSRFLRDNADNQVLEEITADRRAIARALGVSEVWAGLFVLTGLLRKGEQLQLLEELATKAKGSRLGAAPPELKEFARDLLSSGVATAEWLLEEHEKKVARRLSISTAGESESVPTHADALPLKEPTPLPQFKLYATGRWAASFEALSGALATFAERFTTPVGPYGFRFHYLQDPTAADSWRRRWLIGVADFDRATFHTDPERGFEGWPRAEVLSRIVSQGLKVELYHTAAFECEVTEYLAHLLAALVGDGLVLENAGPPHIGAPPVGQKQSTKSEPRRNLPSLLEDQRIWRIIEPIVMNKTVPGNTKPARGFYKKLRSHLNNAGQGDIAALDDKTLRKIVKAGLSGDLDHDFKELLRQ